MLIGATGTSDDWSQLRDHLTELGWQVDPFDPVPPSDGGGPEITLPRLRPADHVILVISSTDPNAGMAAGRLMHAVGVLQGQVGFGRVLALVSDDVGSFLHPTGVTEIRYEEGNLEARFSQVAALLGEATTAEQQPVVVRWFERLGLIDPSLAPEWWLGAGALALVTTVVAVSLIQVLGSGLGGDETTEQIGPLVAVVAGATPGGGTGAEGGSVEGLPATCVIDTRPGVLLPTEIPCEGIGGLTIEGYPGPWHSQISKVSMDTGVVGELLLARTGVAPTSSTVALEPGPERDVESSGSLSGVLEIRLQFSANGQRLRLHQGPAGGGNELTVTFSLDR